MFLDKQDRLFYPEILIQIKDFDQKDFDQKDFDQKDFDQEEKKDGII